jgi:hypothetical protein
MSHFTETQLEAMTVNRNERRRHRDKPFDIQPVPSASLARSSRVRFSMKTCLLSV